jgi:hypothetical protein
VTIQIEVRNKALSVIGEPEIICGNSGYEVQFTFDAEWEKYPVKTARFLYNKHYEWQYEDVVFEGNTVAVPDMYDISKVLVGVYAGDICATTPAEINCKKSILCGDPVHDDPPEDVYNQIMELLVGSGSGKSAYEYAVEAGYEGTEEEFAEQLANPCATAVKTVNGVAPDENGNVQVEAGSADAVEDALADSVSYDLIEVEEFTDGYVIPYNLYNPPTSPITMGAGKMSQPIDLAAGMTIRVYTPSYSTIAVISRYANGKYYSEVRGENSASAYGLYSYTAQEACQVVVSLAYLFDESKVFKSFIAEEMKKDYDTKFNDVWSYFDYPVKVPNYWVEAVDEAVDKITKLQNEGGADLFTFGFITDTHTTSTHKGTFANIMEDVMRKCNIPIFLHGGDFISGIGKSSKEEHLKEIAHHDYIFRNIEDKCLQALGNHDTVFGVDANYDSGLTSGEEYNYIFRKNEQKPGLVFGEPKTYFYKDMPAQRTRYIVLNCYDYEMVVDANNKIVSNSKMSDGRFGTTQLGWLANTALNVPEGYSVIICSHAAPLLDSELPDGWADKTGTIEDIETARGIVSAYNNKTTYADYDFTNYNGEVVCWMAGHTHMDKIFSLSDGLNVIVTANSSSHIQTIDAPAKTVGTDTEYAIDFVCVNTRTRMCTVVRLGAVLESEADSIIDMYENLMDEEAEGYMKGSRINTGGTVVEDGNYYISNYIPVVAGDVLHIKGYYKASNLLLVQTYSEAKDVVGTVAYPTASYWQTCDYDSEVLLITIPSNSSAKYVRISGTTVKPDSELVITKNENIQGTERAGRWFNY